MIPIKFKESNRVIGENQKGIYPMDVFIDDTNEVNVVSCWKLSVFEVFQILFFRKIYLLEKTYGKPIAPKILTASKKQIFET
jgi:hypothetical protein